MIFFVFFIFVLMKEVKTVSFYTKSMLLPSK